MLSTEFIKLLADNYIVDNNVQEDSMQASKTKKLGLKSKNQKS